MRRACTILPSLAAAVLAWSPAPSSLTASEIRTEDLTLRIGLRVQTRLEFVDASNADGSDRDPWQPTLAADEDPQSANFMFRRLRLTVAGAYKEAFHYHVTLAGDGLGNANANAISNVSTGASSTAPILYEVWVAYRQRTEGGTHQVKAGLQQPNYVGCLLDSTANLLFPNGNPFIPLHNVRQAGLSYQYSSTLMTVDAGLLEADGYRQPMDSSLAGTNNEWIAYARIASPLNSEWKLGGRSESYLGKDGLGHELGLAIMLKTDSDGTEDDDWFTTTLDYLFHRNQLTAYTGASLTTFGDGYGSDRGSALLLFAQAGYAFPLASGRVLEPALGLTFVDKDSDNDNELAVLVGDGYGSGLTVDLGVNWYLNGHANKLQAGLSIFSPEDGDGDSVALRLQHQLNF